jgi:autotransporter translocation and assembly factor TamB
VQGFTTALTEVTGTMQAKIDLTGSAADPHANGVVSIDKAAFLVASTGVNYSNLQGKIDLQEDKVHIEHIYVLDNHQSSLSVTGDLAGSPAGSRRSAAVHHRGRLQGDRQQAGQRPAQQQR